MTDWTDGIKKQLKKDRLKLSQEVTSIRDRVRDIEWRIEVDEGLDQASIQDLFNERQRALDKMRQTQAELLKVEEELVEEE